SPIPNPYLYGSMRASLGASTSATVVVPFRPRFRFLVLLLRMCCLKALPRRNLPFLVRLNRFAAPRCVLIFSFFGISSLTFNRGDRRGRGPWFSADFARSADAFTS